MVLWLRSLLKVSLFLGTKKMERGIQGDYIPSTTMPERFLTFVPRPLPPVPPLQLDGELYDLIERANRALGRLDGLTTLLPEPSLFLYLYVRKEALLSSQIEGTQSSFSDLLLYEIEEVPGANSTLRVHNLMRKKPLFSITYAKTELRLTVPTITSALKNLESLGIVKEVTGRSRDRLFVYAEYINILNEGI